MIDIKTIKLVVWDLDDTFWDGVFSEGSVALPAENVQLLKDLTDCGIINSICSKNEYEPTKRHLQDLGVWDDFVFPSINWENKGPQLKEKIEKMALRAVNVLFLDDNPSNLGEALHYLPDIQVGGPDTIKELIEQVSSLEKKDLQHKRLKQYKILEEKDNVSKTYSTSEDFLYDSNIKVAVNHDCLNHIQRIHELLMRSNQLNYTKKRISLEELQTVLNNPDVESGYVTVTDRFGDYGLVGFYAIKEGQLEHFLFSCRTMGQKIEQWVYAQLGFPELEVVGEVRTKLNKSECPGWINFDGEDHWEKSPDKDEELHCRILLKGPCDLSHSQVYIKGTDVFDTEYTYVNEVNGQIIDAQNHSVHIEGLKTYSEDDKRQIVEDCIFVDPVMLTESGFFTKDYDVIFLSSLIESSYYIYQKKGTNIRVVFNGEQLMTNPENWDGYCDGSIRNGDNHFTRAYLQEFSAKYECVGQTTPESYIGFLRKCLQWLPEKTNLCLILGATNSNYDKEDKNNKHKLLNEAIIKFAEQQPRIHYIEIDRCIHELSDFDGDIDHFSNRVYYEIAQSMIKVIEQITGQRIESYSSKIVWFDNLLLKMRKGVKSIFKSDNALYKLMKKFYNKLYKERN